jgi:hypothetical protein
MAVKARANDMILAADRQYCWSNSQQRNSGVNQTFVSTPRGFIDNNYKLKKVREVVEHEKMCSRKWDHNFGQHQYTEEGKITEFARRQFRSSKAFQTPLDCPAMRRRSNFFTGIHPDAEKLDTFATPVRDRYMETTYRRQTGLTQPIEVPEETGFRCRRDIPKREYREYDSRRSDRASNRGGRDPSDPLANPEKGYPQPNSKEKYAIAVIRRNPDVLPYYLKPADFTGPVTLHRPVENTEANRRLTRTVSAPEIPGPHGVTGPPRHHSVFNTRDNWEPVGNWMNSSGYW